MIPRRPVAPLLAAALLSLSLALPSAARADRVEGLLAEARDACEGFEAGVFDPRDAVSEVDLDGAPPLARIVDEARFACSSAASMYCGSGGCAVHAVIGAQVWTWQAPGWRTIEWGPDSILLLGRDGGWCGGAGSQVCYEAVTWSQGDMLTIAPPP